MSTDDESIARNEQVRGSIPRPGSTRKRGLTRQNAEIAVRGDVLRGGDFDKRDTLMTQQLRSRAVRFPAQQVADALDVLPARRCSNAAGWLVRAISDGWQLHDEAQRLRAARTRVQHRDAAASASRHVRSSVTSAWPAGRPRSARR